MKIIYYLIFLLNTTMVFSQLNTNKPIVETVNGKLQGSNESGIKIFKGVPFAAPPVGDLRWKEPQPVESWTGIRSAEKFGPHAMQTNVYGDMNFQSDNMSEDCLYLNVWTPAISGNEKLPVLIYFHGGGFVAGSGDELRYAGKTMAQNGVITVTVNYRLGVFGFLSLPELTKESPNHSSGNYGLLDQNAALKWVKANISAFGGDPQKVTIAGESAGSISVSAQMCSPLSKDLFQQAISSSGSVLGTLPPTTIEEAEKSGLEIAKQLDAKKLKDLRKISAKDLLEKVQLKTSGNIDGYFFPKQPIEIFKAKEENDVPLLIGWNSEEFPIQWYFMGKPATYEGLKGILSMTRDADTVDAILEKYGIASDEDVANKGSMLSSDLFIGYSTWKWCTMHADNTTHPVYRYLYCHPRPAMKQKDLEGGLAGGVKKAEGKKADAPQPKKQGAIHSADIEYAMGNLATNTIYDWNADDYEVSSIFVRYYANFVKTGNPNGLGLAEWPAYNKDKSVMYIDVDTNAKVADPTVEDRYEFLDTVYYPEK